MVYPPSTQQLDGCANRCTSWAQLLATFVPSTWAGPRCAPIGLVLLGSHKQSDYINEEQGLRTAWLGFGRLRPPQLRASFFL
jgi:hypothetical protein